MNLMGSHLSSSVALPVPVHKRIVFVAEAVGRISIPFALVFSGSLLMTIHHTRPKNIFLFFVFSRLWLNDAPPPICITISDVWIVASLLITILTSPVLLFRYFSSLAADCFFFCLRCCFYFGSAKTRRKVKEKNITNGDLTFSLMVAYTGNLLWGRKEKFGVAHSVCGGSRKPFAWIAQRFYCVEIHILVRFS